MMARIFVTVAVLLFSFKASSQRLSSRPFDLLFESVLKTGRFDASLASSSLDSLHALASSPQDSIPILCVRALICNTTNKQSGVERISEAQAFAQRLGVRKYDHQMLFIKGFLLKTIQEDSSFRYLTESLRKASLMHDSVIMSECYTVLSFLEMERGNFVQAWRDLNQSQRLFSKYDYRRIVNNRTNQSHALSAIGLHERAITVANEGTSLIKEHPYPGSKNDLMSLYGNLIESYLSINKPDKALQHAQEACDMFPTLDSLGTFNPLFLISLGNAYLAVDSADRALYVFQRCNFGAEFKAANLQKQYGIFRAAQRLGDLALSRMAARKVIQEIPALRGLKGKLDVYGVAEEAFSFLGLRDSAYHYHQLYFDSYKKLYNQEQSSAILEAEFSSELERERAASQLRALMLESEIRFNKQRTFFLVIILVLIVFLAALLVIRYRSLRKFNSSLEQKVQERTQELTERNNQLSEYAFINAHKVRAPLARILGLTDLMSRESDVREVIRLNHLVKNESLSLDKIVRSINDAISEERVINRNDVS